jgi:hypothetical protein
MHHWNENIERLAHGSRLIFLHPWHGQLSFPFGHYGAFPIYQKQWHDIVCGTFDWQSMLSGLIQRVSFWQSLTIHPSVNPIDALPVAFARLPH